LKTSLLKPKVMLGLDTVYANCNIIPGYKSYKLYSVTHTSIFLWFATGVLNQKV